MSGLTRRQYEREEKRRTTRWRTDLVVAIDALLERINQFHVFHDERPVLTYDQHRDLERLRKTLETDRFMLDPKTSLYPPSELRLELTEKSMTEKNARLRAFETLLIHETQPA